MLIQALKNQGGEFMEGKTGKRNNTRNKSGVQFGREKVKVYWRPLSLQAVTSPERFTRIVGDILQGTRLLFPDFNP